MPKPKYIDIEGLKKLGLSEEEVNAYIAYARSAESACVYVTRDVCHRVNTDNKWTDIIHCDYDIVEDKYKIKTIEVEVFPRIHKPKVTKDMSQEEIDALYWHTSHTDIDESKIKGIIGEHWKIIVNTKFIKRKKKSENGKEEFVRDRRGRYIYDTVYNIIKVQKLPNIKR